MTVKELQAILSMHHPDKEILLIVGGDSEPYRTIGCLDEHDSLYLVGE